MGLETRRKRAIDMDAVIKAEKREINWNKQVSSSILDPDSDKKMADLASIRDLLCDSDEKSIFDEQEAGKATIDTPTEEKEKAKSFEEMSKEEILKTIDDLFHR